MNDLYDAIVPTLHRWQQRGHRVAIATLIDIQGGSPRPVGAQMLLSDSGERYGAISSGCVEADILLAAQQVLNSGESKTYDYGAGSPYLDLTLPCGSAIKIVIAMAPSASAIATAYQAHIQRLPVTLSLHLPSGQWLTENTPHTAHSDVFHCHYAPAKQLLVIGRNPLLNHVVQLASATGLSVKSYTPDSQQFAHAEHLNKPEDFKCPALDNYSAALVLFHDHDWEPPILSQLLDSNAGFIGVLGSRNSHRVRLDALAAMGWSETDCRRLHSPAGLISGTRHPQHIALSMIAQVIQQLTAD
ncbi:MAG: XdhC family protein [Pseudomonadales bacterium]